MEVQGQPSPSPTSDTANTETRHAKPKILDAKDFPTASGVARTFYCPAAAGNKDGSILITAKKDGSFIFKKNPEDGLWQPAVKVAQELGFK